MRDSPVLRGTDPWNDTPLKARLYNLLSRLAVADTFDGDARPAESWQFTTIALLKYAEKPSLSKAAFEVHRHFFPDMGERRRSWARLNRIKGSPPAHKFFIDALRWLPRNGAEGPALVREKYGDAADNVIGLGRSMLAGILKAPDVNTVVMRGAQVAALTHQLVPPRNFASYLAVLTYLWLRVEDDSARPTPMSLLVKSEMARISALIGSLGAIHERVTLGEYDVTGQPPTSGKALDAAQVLGSVLLGPWPKDEPWWMDEKASPHVRALRPILYPLMAPLKEPVRASVALVNQRVVVALTLAGLL